MIRRRALALDWVCHPTMSVRVNPPKQQDNTDHQCPPPENSAELGQQADYVAES
jgi:hypothetical protein